MRDTREGIHIGFGESARVTFQPETELRQSGRVPLTPTPACLPDRGGTPVRVCSCRHPTFAAGGGGAAPGSLINQLSAKLGVFAKFKHWSLLNPPDRHGEGRQRPRNRLRASCVPARSRLRGGHITQVLASGGSARQGPASGSTPEVAPARSLAAVAGAGPEWPHGPWGGAGAERPGCHRRRTGSRPGLAGCGWGAGRPEAQWPLRERLHTMSRKKTSKSKGANVPTASVVPAGNGQRPGRLGTARPGPEVPPNGPRQPGWPSLGNSGDFYDVAFKVSQASPPQTQQVAPSRGDDPGALRTLGARRFPEVHCRY